MSGMPPDPMTALAATAASMFELYESWTLAGFAPDQALSLVIAVMINGINGTSKPD